MTINPFLVTPRSNRLYGRMRVLQGWDRALNPGLENIIQCPVEGDLI